MKKKVLIVRLDAIGDYVLWRNCLRFLRNSRKYRDAHLAILGNPAWRNLAESLDSDCADEWIWATNRGELFRKSVENLYPRWIWHRRVRKAQSNIRNKILSMGFDEVISPVAFRDPLLDELVAGLAPSVVGVAQDGENFSPCYTRLVCAGGNSFVFLRNRNIVAELTGEKCEERLDLVLPRIPARKNRVLFFTGASHWTRRWPIRRWQELSTLLLPGLEAEYAVMTGSLSSFVAQVASSVAVVSNDTMALHVAAALGVPAVGVTNGVSGKDSFWPYPASLGKRVAVCAPENIPTISIPLLGSRLSQYMALSSISAECVAKKLNKMLD